MADDMRTLGYICPQCGAPVMGARSIFALEASDAEIECSCGGSVLHTRYDGQNYRLLVPCGRLPAGADAPGRYRPQLPGQQTVLLLYRGGRHCGASSPGGRHRHLQGKGAGE